MVLLAACGPSSNLRLMPYAINGEALSDAASVVGRGVRKDERVVDQFLSRPFRLRDYCAVDTNGGMSEEHKRELKAELKTELPKAVATTCKAATAGGALSIGSSEDIAIDWSGSLIHDTCHWSLADRCCPDASLVGPESDQEKDRRYSACGDYVVTAIHKTKLTAKLKSSNSAALNAKCERLGGEFSVSGGGDSALVLESEGWNVLELQELHVVCDRIATRGSCDEAPKCEGQPRNRIEPFKTEVGGLECTDPSYLSRFKVKIENTSKGLLTGTIPVREYPDGSKFVPDAVSQVDGVSVSYEWDESKFGRYAVSAKLQVAGLSPGKVVHQELAVCHKNREVWLDVDPIH